MNVVKKRDSNFEILRIISMLMIVFYHYRLHSGFGYTIDNLSSQNLFLLFLTFFGKLGANVFVLISGYFLIGSKNSLSYKKILKFWGQVAFISVVLLLISSNVLNQAELNPSLIISNIFPLASNKYWFATQYILLYCFSPFLNKLFCSLDKATYRKFLCIGLIIFSLLFTITSFDGFFAHFPWFIYLYAFAGYIRLYGFNENRKSIFWFLIFISSLFAGFGLTVLNIYLGMQYNFSANILYFSRLNNAFMLICAVSLFMCFHKMKAGHSKIINFFASATFGVYLIHDNEYFRLYLWNKIFHGSSYQASSDLFIYSIVAVLIVYIACTIIDLIRIYTIEKIFLFLIDRFYIFKLPFDIVYNFSYKLLFFRDKKDDKKL